MNSIEKLIQKKLGAALEEEKRRVAGSLFGEDFATPNMKSMKPVKPVGPTATNQQSNPVEVARKRQQQAMKVQKTQQDMMKLRNGAAKAKDPTAMRQKLSLAASKLQVAKKSAAMTMQNK